MKYEILCRICLEEGELKSIFTTNCLSNVQMSCAEAIINISSVPIKENDGLPNQICKKCLSKLKIAYKFKVLCENSHSKLINRSFENFSLKTEDDQGSEFNNCTKDEIPSPENFHDDFDSQNVDFPSDNQNNSKNMASETFKEIVKDELYSIKDTKKRKKKRDDFGSKRKKENTNNSISNDVKIFNCNFCDATFSNNNLLKKHKIVHVEKKPYFCEICKKNFDSENSHKMSHDRKFQCEICAKVFLRAATLRMHLLAHKNELPFQCTHPGCNKAFPLNSRLKLHLKVHTNERNFICQYCSHAARDKQQLTVHIRYFHTKEKNYLCGTCGKGFVSPQARYYHAKRHENVRNHHCPHCDKSFVFAFGLQEHLVTHTGEKRFECTLCEARFSRKAHKINHETRIHGINKPSTKKIYSNSTTAI